MNCRVRGRAVRNARCCRRALDGRSTTRNARSRLSLDNLLPQALLLQSVILLLLLGSQTLLGRLGALAVHLRQVLQPVCSAHLLESLTMCFYIINDMCMPSFHEHASLFRHELKRNTEEDILLR